MASEFDQIIEHRYRIIEEGVDKLVNDLSAIRKQVVGIDQDAQKSEKSVGRFVLSLDKVDRASRGILQAGRAFREIGDVLDSSSLRSIGGVVSGVGQLTANVVDLANAAKGLKSLGGLGAVIGVLGAGALGVGLGESIYHALGGDKTITFFNTVGKGISVLAGVIANDKEVTVDWAKALGLLEPSIEDVRRATERWNETLRFFGKISGAVEDAVKAAQEAADIYVKGSQAFGDYQNRLASAESAYQQNRLDVINEANSRAIAAQRQYEERRADIIAGFQQQSNEAEAQYYDNRTQLAQQFGVETARMEEDHQRSIRRLIEDSQLRQADLIAGRDALGLARERRNLEIQRRRAEDDYQVAARRRSEDFARQIAQAEQAFRQQQESRQANYEAQLAELAEQHLRERKEIEINKIRRLLELQSQNVQERAAIRNAHIQQLLDIGVFLGEETRLRREAQAQILVDYQSFLNGLIGATPRPGTPSGGRQAGGYSNYGDWLHSGEFVLSAQTTRAAEWMLGGRLSQQRILSGLNQNYNFYGGFSDSEKKAIRRMVYDTSVQAVRDVVRN